MQSKFLAIVILACATMAHAQIYGPNPGGPIPDASITGVAPGTLTKSITITDVGFVFSINSVTLVFGPPNHTWCGDLEVTLIAPNGQDAHLFSRINVLLPTGDAGDSSDLGGAYVFTNSGAGFTAAALATTPTAAIPPGTYARSTATAANIPGGQDPDTFAVFNGAPLSGTWTLVINDWAVDDTGTLASWTLNVSTDGAGCQANIINTGASANNVDVDDLLAVISAWGPCRAPPAACPANIVNTGASANRVDVDDMLMVITNWGPCS